MKTILLLIGLFAASATMAQLFNDTLYFNNGEIRSVNVVTASKNAISYRYKKENGNIASGRMRKALLHVYAIYDENQRLTSRHMNEQRNERKENTNNAALGAGIFVGGLAVITGGAALIFYAIVNMF